MLFRGLDVVVRADSAGGLSAVRSISYFLNFACISMGKGCLYLALPPFHFSFQLDVLYYVLWPTKRPLRQLYSKRDMHEV